MKAVSMALSAGEPAREADQAARPRLVSVDASYGLRCEPGALSLRGWRNHLDRAVVDGKAVVISIGRRKLVDVARLDLWLERQAERGAR